MAKVYVFLANGFEEVEALTVVDILRRAGVCVTIVSVTGEMTVEGSHKIKIIADSIFEENNYLDADCLFLPGGMPGTRNLSMHEGLLALLKEHYTKGKNIAAICAAPSVFGQLGFLAGRRATCYPGFEDKLTGASFVTEAVVKDGNVFTGRGMGTAIELGLALVAEFESEETADKISKGIIYK